MSNQIKTTAPISLENLKQYFTDKSTSYLVDYQNSKLQGQKLLTYIGNLDLNCDLEVSDILDPGFQELLKIYFNSTTLVNIPALERSAMAVLFRFKGLSDLDTLDNFINENIEIVTAWVNKLDSLVLFNTWIIQDEGARAEVLSYPEDTTESVEGINWVSMLKHEDFYYFYTHVDFGSLRNYSKYFNDNLFKGRNLYSFWATEKNPMFIITWGILEQKINSKEWTTLLGQAQQEIKGQQNAASV